MQGERGGEAVEDDQGRSALLEQSLDVGKDARLGHRLIGLHVEELSELLIRQAERAQPLEHLLVAHLDWCRRSAGRRHASAAAAIPPDSRELRALDPQVTR